MYWEIYGPRDKKSAVDYATYDLSKQAVKTMDQYEATGNYIVNDMSKQAFNVSFGSG